MIRSKLIDIVAAENPHLYQRDVEKIVNTIFDRIRFLRQVSSCGTG